jgi:flagellar capping protein FliD
MIRSLILASALTLFSAFICAAQSASSGEPSPSDPPKPAVQSQSTASAAPQAPGPAANTTAAKDQASEKDQAKKKPKKVWTNDEMSTIRGKISVVGDPSQSSSYSDSRQWNNDSDSGNSSNTDRGNVIANYRERIRQLREQQDAIDKKISEFRSFKADNSSPDGGINTRTRYSMTPAGDEIKQLEDKKKEIQAKIDAIEEEARKNGVEPGELR